jgi:hypothetical protein
MVLRVWYEVEKVFTLCFWKPAVWQVFRMYAYESSYYSRSERQSIATAAYARDRNFKPVKFTDKDAAGDFATELTYGK